VAALGYRKIIETAAHHRTFSGFETPKPTELLGETSAEIEQATLKVVHGERRKLAARREWGRWCDDGRSAVSPVFYA
jgi:hypothetical protein